WYAERDAEIENEKLRREVEELRQASETDLQPGTIEYERHRLTRAQADAQELKNARDSAEVVETAFCTFVLSRIAGEIASILDGIPLSVQRRFPELENRHVDFLKRDIIKAMNKAAALDELTSGTITVRVYDDQPFDRQIVIPAVAFSGAKHEQDHTDIYSSCRLIVRKNGAEIYNRTALDNTLIYTGVIDMPAGSGVMTLEFSVSAWLVNGWYPTASISDLLVVVMKKATAGISIS
ncbi:TPA: terminase small subunit, partial [Escherichia coli]